MNPLRLYVWQRMTAAVLAPMIIVHLIVILYASRNGLSAAEILGRTRGSVVWASFYSVFVVAAAIHGAIGLRGVAREWLSWRPAALDRLMWISGLLLLVLGIRAVIAVAS